MPIITNRRAGIGLVGVLVAIAAVAIISGAGYTVYNYRSQQNSAGTVSTTQPAVQPAASDTLQAPDRPSAPDTAMTIREWGVQLYLTAAVKDAYYVPDLSNESLMFIGLTSLDSETCKATGNTATKTPVASLTRVKPDERDPVSGDLYTDRNKNGVQLGDYYYAYNGWHRTRDDRNICGSDERLREIDNAFIAAIKTAKTTPAGN